MDGMAIPSSGTTHFSVNSSPVPSLGTNESTGKSQLVNVKLEPSSSLMTASNSPHTGSSTTTTSASQPMTSLNARPNTAAANAANSERKILDKRRLHDLAKEVDPMLQLDEDVEELMLQIADDFIDNVVSSACEVAKHRKSNTLETKDLHLVLERNYNMWVPGFGSDEIRPYKKAHVTDAHKQRLALIKKTMKKF